MSCLFQKYKVQVCTLCPNMYFCFTLLYGQSTLFTELNEKLILSKFTHNLTGPFKSTAFSLSGLQFSKLLEFSLIFSRNIWQNSTEVLLNHSLQRQKAVALKEPGNLWENFDGISTSFISVQRVLWLSNFHVKRNVNFDTVWFLAILEKAEVINWSCLLDSTNANSIQSNLKLYTLKKN